MCFDKSKTILSVNTWVLVIALFTLFGLLSLKDITVLTVWPLKSQGQHCTYCLAS
jgi:hypothetical protein